LVKNGETFKNGARFAYICLLTVTDHMPVSEHRPIRRVGLQTAELALAVN